MIENSFETALTTSLRALITECSILSRCKMFSSSSRGVLGVFWMWGSFSVLNLRKEWQPLWWQLHSLFPRLLPMMTVKLFTDYTAQRRSRHYLGWWQFFADGCFDGRCNLRCRQILVFSALTTVAVGSLLIVVCWSSSKWSICGWWVTGSLK